MDENKKAKESTNWKAEEAREKRKERLASLKDKDGQKKPIKEKGKKARIASIVLALVIVIGFVVWFLINNGLMQRKMTAFSVNYDEAAYALPEVTEVAPEESEAVENQSSESQVKEKGQEIGKVSVAEANIYLGLLSQQYIQSGAFSTLGQDQLSQPSQFNPDGTLRDDFLTSVEMQAKNAEYFYWQAKQEGLELDEADEANLENIITQYNSMAAQGQVTLNHYLNIMFGPGVNENVFRDFFAKNALGNKYYQSIVEGFVYDQATVDSIYEENPDNYNVVDYRSYLFTGIDPVENPDPNAPPAEPDLEKAKQQADEFAAQVTDDTSFKKAADSLMVKTATDPSQINLDTDISLTEGARKLYLSPVLSEWLFSEERTADDITVIEEANGFRVVLFLEKYKPTDIGMASSRQILFQIDVNDPEKSDEKIKARAEEVLAQFEAGNKTEESFAELAREFSEDPGSVSNGGLYTNIPAGQFVPEYEAFTLDPNRTEGDVEIIKTDYGYHIIYFIDSAESWIGTIKQELRYKDEQEFMMKVDNATQVIEENGIKYFGKP